MKLKAVLLVPILFGVGCQKDLLGKSLLSSSPESKEKNAKVFLKNPVYSAKEDVGYKIVSEKGTLKSEPSSEINFDRYLINVTISETKNGFLENDHYRILPSGGIKRARPDSNGRWIFSSTGDPDLKLGQAMAYFWLNYQRKKANATLEQGWHASGKKIRVDSNCVNAGGDGYNAYWSPEDKMVCMGRVGNFQTAFDASIYNHELGHANALYATNGQIYENISDTKCNFGSHEYYCCKSDEGCIGAIDEGQADFHAYMVFNSGVMAEFFVNDTMGLDERNAEYNTTKKILTAQDRFSSGSLGVEIHSMGGVWGAALWNLRKTIGSKDADKIFLAQQELLSGPDTFRTALNSIIVANKQLFDAGKISKNYETEITQVFAQHGIKPFNLAEWSGKKGQRMVASVESQPSLFARIKRSLQSVLESLREFLNELL